jgi:phosphatidylglycerol:prolipoprotein diacylglycerol transferase
MKHIIGFPGLFDSRYVIDRVAFDLGKLFGADEPMYVYWYGLIIVLAMITAYVYFMIRSKRSEGIVEDHTMNVALFALPLGIVGARTFYVLTNLSHFDSLKDAVFGIRDGGLAIYGGIVFGLITVIVYCYIKKINCFKMLDALSPAVMIAQAIGRWGNFFNAEAYGSSDGVKDFFLRMSIADFETPYGIKYVHPTFLYESLWNIVGFIIANILYRKKNINGQIFCFYLAWYGLGRAFIELLRTDSCMILGGLVKNDPLDLFGTARESGLKAFVYLSLVLVITGIVLFIVLYKKHKREEEELVDFESTLVKLDELYDMIDETKAKISDLKEKIHESEERDAEFEKRYADTNKSPEQPLPDQEDEDYEDGEEGSDEYDDGEDGNDGYDD